MGKQKGSCDNHEFVKELSASQSHFYSELPGLNTDPNLRFLLFSLHFGTGNAVPLQDIYGKSKEASREGKLL
jgi:hypothetical protein